MKKEKELPVLLVIGGDAEEDWYTLRDEYKDKFRVEQRPMSEVFLISYHNQKGPYIELAPSRNPKNRLEEKAIHNLHPTVVIVRMMTRYINCHIGETPDYRNILYGLYHSNVPIINGYGALIAETEKPILYGRLKIIQDKVGAKEFPLIPQYYFPEYELIKPYATFPFVLKVGFPHAGFGKMKINNEEELSDAKNLIALGNTYSSVEPFIDSEYELRICFIAPDYYRVHKRMSCSWKVNYGMTNVREDSEMTPRWKRWVDLIRLHFPDMMTFAVDAIVDTNGNEYILEVNGSSQGFTPEHDTEDLIHMRNLCIMKIEEVTGKKILKDENEEKIININDKIEKMKKTIEKVQLEIDKTDKQIDNLKFSVKYIQKKEKIPVFSVIICTFVLGIIINYILT